MGKCTLLFASHMMELGSATVPQNVDSNYSISQVLRPMQTETASYKSI